VLATYTQGETIKTISFCSPKPKGLGRACGGHTVKNQYIPSGPLYITNLGKFAHGNGPYHFRIPFHGGGFLPSGLVLRPNGLLTGTVLPYTAARRWPFTVCVTMSPFLTFTTTKPVCRATSIVITKPAPPPPPPPVAAANFSGQWHGTYSGYLTPPGCPIIQIGGPVAFSITQTGTSLFVTSTETDGYVTWDTSSCAIISRSVNTLSFGATVDGRIASGTTSGGSSVKLTMAADLTSFSGNLQGTNQGLTFTNVVRG
jgi:hypothetical protein